jgi:Ca-activated chloride channel family protein
MRKILACLSVLFAASSLVACGSGGPSGGGSAPPPATPTPRIQVLPASFDFGRVTSGNTSAPLEVTIRNTGTVALGVTGIGLVSTAFSVNLNGGARPCGSATPTIAAGDSCTFRVSFQPTGNGSFNGSVQIGSNDPAAPMVALPITGTSEAVTALAVRVNQVETACPGNAATAFVSVTDQGGFPVTGLGINNFRVLENATALTLTGAQHVDAAYRPLALAAVVDNSASITSQPVAFTDVKNGFTALFNEMRANDVGELIAFGSTFAVRVAFPSPSNTSNPTNKDALVAGLGVAWSGEANSLLYDSVVRAIDGAALQTAYRRAVVVATDGIDEGVTPGVRLSTNTLADVIARATSRRVPVYTIGIGTQVNATVLSDMASRTGGVFFQASTSQNLATIYQQLASLLFRNQYVLTFDQLALGQGVIGALQVNADLLNGVTGSGTGAIASCN